MASGARRGTRQRGHRAGIPGNCTRGWIKQGNLGKLVPTTASVICHLEVADYDGHSLAMFRRIAAALNQQVEIRLVPQRRRLQHA